MDYHLAPTDTAFPFELFNTQKVGATATSSLPQHLHVSFLAKLQTPSACRWSRLAPSAAPARLHSGGRGQRVSPFAADLERCLAQKRCSLAAAQA